MNAAPFMSVVVPTHNRAAILESCLASLVALDYPNDAYELIVVDAASSDDTHQRVHDLGRCADVPEIAYLRRRSPDANAARNAGIAVARGKLIALIDDDVIVPVGWLRALATGAARWPGAECFGGPVRPLFEARPPATCRAHALAGTMFDEGLKDRQIRDAWGGNMALRPEGIALAGPFREGLRLLQDWEWHQRLTAAGGMIVYLPDAWLWHKRLRRDMRVACMLREFFLRGYLRGILDDKVKARHALRRARHWATHATRTRCTRGVTETARSIGLLFGVIRRRAQTRIAAAR